MNNSEFKKQRFQINNFRISVLHKKGHKVTSIRAKEAFICSKTIGISNNGLIVTGHVISGVVKAGDEIVIELAGQHIVDTVCSIQKDGKNIDFAQADDYIGICLSTSSLGQLKKMC